MLKQLTLIPLFLLTACSIIEGDNNLIDHSYKGVWIEYGDDKDNEVFLFADKIMSIQRNNEGVCIIITESFGTSSYFTDFTFDCSHSEFESAISLVSSAK